MNDDRLVEILTRIEKDQRRIFGELTGLIKESTTAIVSVKQSLRPPFWKTESFYLKLLIIVFVFVVAYQTVQNSGCLELYDYAVVGCR